MQAAEAVFWAGQHAADLRHAESCHAADAWLSQEAAAGQAAALAVQLAAAVDAEIESQAQACRLQGELWDQVMVLQVRFWLRESVDCVQGMLCSEQPVCTEAAALKCRQVCKSLGDSCWIRSWLHRRRA